MKLINKRIHVSIYEIMSQTQHFGTLKVTKDVITVVIHTKCSWIKSYVCSQCLSQLK